MTDEAAATPVTVTPYTDAEVSTTPHARWAFGTSAVTESVQTKLELRSGQDRRFVLTAGVSASDPSSGRVFYLEFGRGAAYVEPGTYTCESLEAVVVVIRGDESRVVTATSAGTQRPCTVHIDQATEQVGTPAWNQGNLDRRTTSFRRVTGRVEAELGPREDAAAVTIPVRAAFSAIFRERDERL